MKAMFCDWCGKEFSEEYIIEVKGLETRMKDFCTTTCAVDALKYYDKIIAYRVALSEYSDKGGLGRLRKTFDEYLKEQGVDKIYDRKVERTLRHNQ